MVNTALKKVEGFKGEAKIILVDPTKLVFSDDNPRRDHSSPEDKQLRLFLRRGGQVPPILVRRDDEGHLVIVDGTRRVTETLALIKEGVPMGEMRAELTDESDSATLIAISLSRNDGKPLDPVETAEAYARLVSLGKEGKQIADMISRTPAHVSEYLTLARASNQVKKQVIRKELSVREAVQIVRQVEAQAKAEGNGEGAADGEPIAPEAQEALSLEKRTKKQEKQANRKGEPLSDVPSATISLSALSQDAGLELTTEEKSIQRIIDKHGLDGTLAIMNRAIKSTIGVIGDKERKSKWKSYQAALREMQRAFDEYEEAA